MAGPDGAPVLVTGANGFVGSHLVEELLRRGRSVRCAVRPRSSVEALPSDRVEIVRVDYDRPATLDAAVDSCVGVVHLAGATRADSPGAYRAANVEPVRSLAAACRRAGPHPGRFVLVSSLAAAGPSRRDRPRVEDDPEQPLSEYGRSKLEAESVLRSAEGPGDDWAVLRPCAVYGPRDRDFLRLARMVVRGWVVRVGSDPVLMSVVHAQDLARALADVLAHPGAAGRTWFVADPDPAPWDRIAGLMAEACGRHPRWLTVPPGLLPVIAEISSWVSAVTRSTNPLPADRLAELRAEAWTCSPARIAADIGFTTRVRLAEGLASTLRWYQKEGWLAR